MFISTAYAQAASPFGGGDMLTSLLPFALIFVIMYFLILRPQQKRVKAHQELVKNVRRGDTVLAEGLSLEPYRSAVSVASSTSVPDGSADAALLFRSASQKRERSHTGRIERRILFLAGGRLRFTRRTSASCRTRPVFRSRVFVSRA